MRPRSLVSLILLLAFTFSSFAQTAPQASPTAPAQVFGFRDFTEQAKVNQKFLAVPDPKLAEEHLRILTAAPHVAGSPEDKKTAEYVAQRFREAGLETEIVEYKVWMNYPKEISVEATAPAGVKMKGPHREQVSDDPFQNDPRVLMAFNGYSPSGEAEADIVYANYGRPEDFKKLKEMNIDVRGKIALVRYGQNFRGVKSYVGQEYGVAGVIIYSDPIDDGYYRGDKYPKGPWRPDTAVQRGSVQYLFKYPGDPTTPGVASVVSLPDAQRISPKEATNLSSVPTTPISYADATPLMANLAGPESPREWQGALPFTYHVGPGPVRVKMKLKQDYAFRSIWNVIGKVKGSQYPDEWVVAGNHRDAWVYGAVDPNSGTAAMLEAVHGVGELLKSGWRPKRTLVFGSWDAEEQGLIGSTEWVEQYSKEMATVAAYFNMDVAVSGPNFGASAVPSLKRFVRDVARMVPSAKGTGTVYDAWKAGQASRQDRRASTDFNAAQTRPAPAPDAEVNVGDLGSGSDYTPFLQHAGVPATDIGSSGSYGVYHSVFDNFNWYKKFGDPTFIYSKQMAQVLGLEMLHMANADVLPLDYKSYGEEIKNYLKNAKTKAGTTSSLDFEPAFAAAERFAQAGAALAKLQADFSSDPVKLNTVLRDAERALLLDQGLPKRPWFKHAIYAPGEYTGYAAVVIPGVNEALDAKDDQRAASQLAAITAALQRAAKVMESVAPAPTM
ncbi:MAG TPA: M28 family metallopeptidase [Terriglobales bacterium]|nr:M28 family metallopeptidase [Terriglobales bacterium]